MKLFFKFIILLTFLVFQKSQSQSLDTLVDVGNHKIRFNIIRGNGIPILFESSGGADSKIWNSILDPIYKITGTTIITYDRAGHGKSTVDNTEKDVTKHGIISLVEDLEIGLKKLGYDKEIILVAHSYGGYLATLYATRHPKLVKSVILIDVNHNFMDKYGEEDFKSLEKHLPEMKEKFIGLYYQVSNERETTKMMSQLSIPQNIPVVDFVAGIPLFQETDKIEHWKECHKKFVESHPKSKGIMAYECGHSIWYQNPSLIINTIAKSYAETQNNNQKILIYERAMNYAINSSNDVKRENKASLENNLNDLGYEYAYKNENEKALEIFKLNTLVFTTSSNAFGSYAEQLVKLNRKEEAIKMYQKSIDVDPGNEGSKRALADLLVIK
jgi:tetratricopeptide (TPR) repeat protein